MRNCIFLLKLARGKFQQPDRLRQIDLYKVFSMIQIVRVFIIKTNVLIFIPEIIP